ncbi:MAG: TonB-dependent receptor [Acidobacteriaceae bacterium]|nr:TonB-dependent receptor [Acidobacteriaceae bacterium]
MLSPLRDLSATFWRRRVTYTAAVGALALTVGAAAAQSLAGLGALNGVVRDPSGAVVPNADVELVNKNLGIDRHLKSTSDGLYLFPSLRPGEGYVIVVTAAGFGTSKTTSLTVHVGEQLAVPMSLTVNASDSVTVSDATAPIVDTSKTETSALINQAQIMNLPINGRRVDQFALLSPGVVQDGTTGEISFHGVPSGNAFLQDGVDVTNQWFVQNAGGSAVLSNISQDAVQEFRTEVAGYSAEFGRGAGGVVNTITKSGTNMFHGGAFWFFRNRTLNATDLFSKRTVNGTNVAFNPSEYRHQYGGTVGGPIIKDKLFFFASYEGTKRNFPIQSTLTSATVLDANGQLLTGACDTTVATVAQCTAAQTYLNRFHNATVPRNLNQNGGFGRIDWRQNDKSSWAFTGNLLNYSGTHVGVSSAAVTDGSGTSAVNYNVSTHIRNGHISNTYLVTDHSVNELRLGYNQDHRFQGLPTDLLPPGALRSALSVGPVSNLGVSVNALPNKQPSETRYTFDDTYSISKGKHQIKVGASLAYLRSYENGIYKGPGQYTYNSFTTWAQDLTPLPTDTLAGRHYAGFTQAIGHPITRITIRDYDFFAQDQWQITQKLMLNLGVRYDYATYTQPPAPAFAATDSTVGKINQPKLNFSPRIGFSYAENGGKTVFRGNYGIFYNRLPGATITRLQQLGGTIRKSLPTLTPATTYAPNYPAVLTDAALSTIPSSLVNTGFTKPGLGTPYVQEAQLGVEQQLSKDTSLNIGYLWARGLKFLQRSDLNIGAPTGSQTYTVNELNGTSHSLVLPTYLASAKKYSQYAQILQIDNSGRIWYDGLLVELKHRENRFLQGSINYTWSKAEDLTQGAASSNYYFSDTTDTLFNGAFPVNGRSGYSYEKGISAEDTRHRVVISGIAMIPTDMFHEHWKQQALAGWQLSPVFVWATPQHVNSTLTISASNSAWYQSGSITGLGGESPAYNRVPFLPISNLPLGTTAQLDARLTKKFPIKNAQTIELSFEAINALNHIRYTSVNQVGYTANGATSVITAASTAWPSGYGRGTASAGFPDGTNARRAQAAVRYTF